jgi:hypothetical protein
MAFWDWLNKDYEQTGERFGYAKRIAVGIIVFLLIPILIYFLITWNPVIDVDEDGEPTKLGIYVVIGLYWLGAYFAYKRHKTKIKLNRLLDKLLNDEEADHLFEAAKRRRQILKEEKFPLEEGEDRGKWFGI